MCDQRLLPFVTMLVAVFLACGPAAADAPDRVVNIALEDQFKNRHETLRYRGIGRAHV